MAETGIAPRKAALKILMAVLGRGVPFDAASAAADDLPGPDRGLARLLALTVLRWQVDLDVLIDSVCARPLPADARVRHVLRLALAGAIKLETPPHATIATALPLLEGGPRRLAHGVLGTLFRQGALLPLQPTLPPPFATRWAADWGADVAEAAADILAQEPATDVTLRDPAETELWTMALEGTSLAPGHVRTSRRGSITSWPGFATGAWWVQDLAASLPVRLLGDVAGQRVLDVCAAPGGKAMQLAAAGADVVALDVNEGRLGRIKDNLERTGLAAQLVAGDALRWQPDGLFDAVLVDAPCSATGIFRRHPDVLHLKGSGDITPLTLVQAALLRRAVAWLKPGGTLVYATCSLDPREGEAVAERVVAGLQRWPVEPNELPAGLQPTGEGWVRTLPGQLADVGGLDGFFISRFRKLAD